MAKKDKVKLNYAQEVRQLKENGPQRLYLLYGPEDYLRERFLEELRKICVPEGDDFSYKRLDGPVIDLGQLQEAVDSVPFFSERTLVEVRGYDINKCRENDCERLKSIIGDLPDYCTLVFVIASDYDLDGRLAAVKALKKAGKSMEFTEQEGSALVGWITNRFKALGKSISRSDAEYLSLPSGTRMNSLIPEIEKAAAYAAGETVSRADIDTTANRIPEADVFAMTDMIARRRFDDAAGMLSDLLSNRENHPILLTALIGQQMRRLYAVKLGQAAGRSRADMMERCSVRYDFIYDKLVQAARAFSEEQLGNIVKLCAEYDFRMKSTGLDANILIRELFARIVAGQ